VAEPHLICGLVAQCRGSGEIGEVRSGGAKLVPERRGSVAGKAHSVSLAKNGAVDAFSMAILRRGVGGSNDMIDPQGKAPVFHAFGNKFTIIGDKDLQWEPSLCRHMFMPQLENRSGIPLTSQRKTPDVT